MMQNTFFLKKKIHNKFKFNLIIINNNQILFHSRLL